MSPLNSATPNLGLLSVVIRAFFRVTTHRISAHASLCGLITVFLLLFAPGTPSHARPAPADTIYVDTDASGAEDGSSWTDAYTSLQDGLEAARKNGKDDAVWVAGGTYYPDEGTSVQSGDRTASFRVESGIDLRGHFSGDEESLSGRTLDRGGPKTILSGEIQQDGSAANNAYTVLRLTGGSAGEVHIEDGAANGSGAQRRGGGAHVSGGALHHAVFTGNRAGRGAALLITGSPSLDVLRVTGNHATGSGALYFNGDGSTVEHLTVADNTADDGPTGLYFIDSDAALEDVAAGSNASSAVAERIPITFTNNTIGSSHYSNSKTFDYQVSTDDTTFTVSNDKTVEFPFADGDQLEITHSDPDYIDRFTANETPIFAGTFPDQPSYDSNNTISISKTNTGSELNVYGIRDELPLGEPTSDVTQYFGNAPWTDRDGYDEVQISVLTTDLGNQDPVSDSNIDRMQTAINDVAGVMPFPVQTQQNTVNEYTEIDNNRSVNKGYIAIFDSPGNSYNTSGGFGEEAESFTGPNEDLATTRSEAISSMTGINEFVAGFTSGDLNANAPAVIKMIYGTQ